MDKPSKSNDVGFEKLFEELRDVLSDLGQEKSFEPPPAEPLLQDSDNPILNSSTEADSERLGEAAFQNAAKPDGPNPSDEDFWAGNVLGWPAGSGDPAGPAPVKFGESDAPSEPPIVLEGPETSMESAPLESGPIKSDEPDPVSATSWLESMPGEAVLPSPPELRQQKVPEPDIAPAEVPFPEFEPSPAQKAPEISTERPVFDNFPMPPVAPSDLPAEGLKNRVPGAAAGGSKEELEIDRFFTGVEQSEPQPVAPAASAPVPKKPAPGKKALQVAYICPSGQEAQCQQFAATLRLSAAKAPQALTVQPVFVHGWVPGQIDIPAWKKAALLAGANHMFVIASKKDRHLFLSLSADPSTELQARLIALEHLNLRTLTADLLADLSRTSNG